MNIEYICGFDKFINKAHSKFYFIHDREDIEYIPSDNINTEPLNTALMNYVLNVLIDKFINIDKIKNPKEFVNTIPKNSTIYCFQPAGLEDPPKPVDLLFTALRDRSKDLAVYHNMNLTSSKVETQKLLGHFDFFPNEVFKRSEIPKIGYPVVAKPDRGHSGIGIQKFNDKKELTKYLADKSNPGFDLFSEYIDFSREFRAMFVKNKLIYIGERIPKIKQNVSVDNKKADDEMAFVYVVQNMEAFPYKEGLLKINEQIRAEIDLDVYSLDFFLDKDKNLKIIELNSQTGLDPIKLLAIYEQLKMENDNFASADEQTMIARIKNLYFFNEYSKYKQEIDKSISPINYQDSTNDYKLRNLVNKYQSDNIKNF